MRQYCEVIIFSAPIVVVVVLKSTLYDGWRHMFFIYPFLAYFMAMGFSAGVKWFNGKFQIGNQVTTILFGMLVFAFVYHCKQFPREVRLLADDRFIAGAVCIGTSTILYLF